MKSRLFKASIATLVLAPSLLYGQGVSGPGAQGQVVSGPGAQAQAAVVVPNAVAAPKRLSDWMLEQPADPNAYPLGLSWRVPGEVPAQSKLRLGLLRNLSGPNPAARANPEALRRLHDWVGTLPVTGRVPVAVPDARWLQANPARDPLFK